MFQSKRSCVHLCMPMRIWLVLWAMPNDFPTMQSLHSLQMCTNIEWDGLLPIGQKSSAENPCCLWVLLPQVVLEGQAPHSALLWTSLDVAQELCFSNCSQVSSLNVAASFKISEWAFFCYIKDFKYVCILFDFFPCGLAFYSQRSTMCNLKTLVRAVELTQWVREGTYCQGWGLESQPLNPW